MKAKPADELEEYLRTLEHPLKKELESLRKLILEAAPGVREGYKWNSLSFRKHDWFATVNVTRTGPPALRLVLHTGAKKSAKAPQVADPAGLLERLGKDRVIVTISNARDLREKRGALQSILIEWIGQL